MFQSPKKRMRALLDVVDDMLAGAPEPEAAPHPHRRPAHVRIERRAGTVAARPMHCLCPMRPLPATGETARDALRDG